MNIVLVGFMGSGKSSTARFISKNFKFRFVDTDKIIERNTHTVIKEIFDKHGENFFRNLERTIIKTDLSFCCNCVIATGGGMPCHFNNMDMLKRIGWVFHLDIDFNDIVKRVKNRSVRPLLNDIEKAKLLYEQRKRCYEKAHFHIDANRTTKEIAEEIIYKINPAAL